MKIFEEINKNYTIGLIFDVDELLFDNRREIFLAYVSLLTTRNIAVYPKETFPGKNLFDIINNLRGRYSIEDSIEVLVAERREKYIQLLKKSNALIKYGVWTIFNYIHHYKPNVRLAYATSSEQSFTNIILGKVFNQCGVPREFFFYTSTCWKPGMLKKPNPVIYLETIEKLGLPTSQCIAFEDSKSGVEAALSAGLKVICVPSSNSAACIRSDRLQTLESLGSFMPTLMDL